MKKDLNAAAFLFIQEGVSRLIKICKRVVNSTNSNIVLNRTGGEKLLGRGDLLCDRGKGIERAQSPYVTQEELRELTS